MSTTQTIDTRLLSRSAIDAVQRPIREASGMPNAAYTSAEFFSAERDVLFANSWACVGFASDIPERGYAQPLSLMGLPLVALRDRKGVLRVFHNVCSHRGHKLVNEPCKTQGMVRCPYHSWTYGLDGSLRGTPHIAGTGEHELDGFDKSAHGLKPLRSAQWMDMIFVNLSGDAPEFAEHIAPLAARWAQFWGDDGLDQLRRVNMGGSLQVEVGANWKLAVENYLESYHLPWVHPALNSYSRLEDHYNITLDDRFAGQGSTAYLLADVAGTSLPRFPAWPQDRLKHAEYIAVYPNVLLGVQVDHAFAMIVEPVAPDHSVEHLQLYYVGDESCGDEYAAARTATLESWRTVFSEDISAVEGMQAGRSSPGFGGGVFSPVMDAPTHHFHQWTAEQLQVAVAG